MPSKTSLNRIANGPMPSSAHTYIHIFPILNAFFVFSILGWFLCHSVHSHNLSKSLHLSFLFAFDFMFVIKLIYGDGACI